MGSLHAWSSRQVGTGLATDPGQQRHGIAEILRWLAARPVEGLAGTSRRPGQVLTIDRDLVCRVISQRLSALARTASGRSRPTGVEPGRGPDRNDRPVNPVALCAALAHLERSGSDFCGVVDSYVSGGDPSVLNDSFGSSFTFDDPEEMVAHEALEERLLDTLCVVATARLAVFWPWGYAGPDHDFSSATAARVWAELSAAQDPSVAAGVSDREAVRLEAWFLVNPTYLVREYDDVYEGLIREGWTTAGRAQEALSRCRQQVAVRAEALNTVLREPGALDEKRADLVACRDDLDAAAARLRHARNLYTWGPHEIEARWLAGLDRRLRETEGASR